MYCPKLKKTVLGQSSDNHCTLLGGGMSHQLTVS